MIQQTQLFSPENLAATVVIPRPPALVPHQWPFPGMTPDASARASIANSEDYFDMLAAVIKANGGAELTKQQVLAKVPDDWRELCRNYAHGSLDFRTGEERGIKVKYVPHEDGGFHLTFQAVQQ